MKTNTSSLPDCVTAIVTAAGKGKRLPGKVKKQYLELNGHPVLAWTLHRFCAHPSINRVLLVVPEDDREWVGKNIVQKYGLGKVEQLLPGGEERQDSISNALPAIGHQCKWVLVHDGVRPFVTPQEIDRVLLAAKKSGSAVLATPVSETIKKVNGTVVEKTVDRKRYWLAQTPQVFERGLFMEAYENAVEEGFLGTDDASLAERTGAAVTVVEGSRLNLKITVPDDLLLAQAIFPQYFNGNELREQ